MSTTRNRLEEAKYFFHRLKEDLQGPCVSTKSNCRAFMYDLSAFLTFARGITRLPDTFHARGMLSLENEFHQKCGFWEWYYDQVTKMKDDQLARFFVCKRNFTVYEKPLQFQGSTTFTFIEYNTIIGISSIASTSMKTTQGERKGMIAQSTSTETTVLSTPMEILPEQPWFFDELPGGMLPENQVITVCEKYIAQIERLVNECEMLNDLPPDFLNRVELDIGMPKKVFITR